MSAFEDFVQQELPKRGYLNSDVPQESIIIRRGLGPRQFDAVPLTEGQVLAFVNGSLTGASVTDSGLGGGAPLRKYVGSFTNLTTWTINHNLGSEDVLIQAFDADKFVLIPNSIQIVDADTGELTFNSPVTGTARVIFLD